MAAGVLVTFLPLALTAKSAALATTALFVQPAASTVARWPAGRRRVLLHQFQAPQAVRGQRVL